MIIVYLKDIVCVEKLDFFMSLGFKLL